MRKKLFDGISLELSILQTVRRFFTVFDCVVEILILLLQTENQWIFNSLALVQMCNFRLSATFLQQNRLHKPEL